MERCSGSTTVQPVRDRSRNDDGPSPLLPNLPLLPLPFSFLLLPALDLLLLLPPAHLLIPLNPLAHPLLQPRKERPATPFALDRKPSTLSRKLLSARLGLQLEQRVVLLEGRGRGVVPFCWWRWGCRSTSGRLEGERLGLGDLARESVYCRATLGRSADCGWWDSSSADGRRGWRSTFCWRWSGGRCGSGRTRSSVAIPRPSLLKRRSTLRENRRACRRSDGRSRPFGRWRGRRSRAGTFGRGGLRGGTCGGRGSDLR